MEEIFNSRGKLALRSTLRTMEVGDTYIIPKTTALPSTVRSTCSNLNTDFGVVFGTQSMPEATKVIRSK